MSTGPGKPTGKPTGQVKQPQAGSTKPGAPGAPGAASAKPSTPRK